MSEACGISYDILACTAEWYVREETLRGEPAAERIDCRSPERNRRLGSPDDDQSGVWSDDVGCGRELVIGRFAAVSRDDG
ncbi:MAG: hypothetical protein ACRDTT_18310, partial [Pseudonocardiaceae bacterium]